MIKQNAYFLLILARDKRSGWNNFSEFMELPERPKSLDDIEIVDPRKLIQTCIYLVNKSVIIHLHNILVTDAERVFRANESLLHFRTEVF